MKKNILLILILLIKNICYSQDIESARYPVDPANQLHPEISKGELLQFEYKNSKIFSGTTRTYWIYVPAAYKPDKPACLFVDMDNVQFNSPAVFDYLITKGEIPVTIGVFVGPGATMKNDKDVIRYNRGHEFDTMNSDFVNFLLTELLPEVETKKTADGRAIRISKDGNDHVIAGASSGAICAFTAAWLRPDAFSRVYSTIGTYVGMRGGDQYPVLIRKTEPKPIRIYLYDGSKDAWNPLFGSWYASNLNMEAALSFAGYEVAHTWGSEGHTVGKLGNAIFPDVIRWLWKGWPQKLQAGVSNNNMLKSILPDGGGWQSVNESTGPVNNIFSGLDGRVMIQAKTGQVYTIDTIGVISNANKINKGGIMACGPTGEIYLTDQTNHQVLLLTKKGEKKTIVKNLSASSIAVTNIGNLYIAEPAAYHSSDGKIWLVKPDGSKNIVDTGMQFISSITISPDKTMLLAAENNTNWIYSFVIQADGTLKDKQRWYWLHQTDDYGYSKTSGLAMDSGGNLYAATNLGVQVCDQNGRVRAILSPPYGNVTGLCFGGNNFNTLFIVCNGKLYKRKLKTYGILPWAKPFYPKSIGAG